MPEQSLKRQLKVLTIPVFIEMALVMLLFVALLTEEYGGDASEYWNQVLN